MSSREGKMLGSREMVERLSTLPCGIRRKAFALLRPRRALKLRNKLMHDPLFAGFKRLNTVFVQIPKTATTSINRLLFNANTGQHYRIDEYPLIFPEHELEQMFSFAFTRNPWDRLASAYRYLMKGGNSGTESGFRERFLLQFHDFEQFVVEGVGNRTDECFEHVLFIPQSRFVCIGDNDTPAVDFIGRYERLDEDFRVVLDRLGMSDTPHTALTKANQSSNNVRNYRDLYTPEMRDIVARVYSKDIRLFNYSF